MNRKSSDRFSNHDQDRRQNIKSHRKSVHEDANCNFSKRSAPSNQKEIGEFWKQVLRWKQTPGDIDDFIFSENESSSENISDR